MGVDYQLLHGDCLELMAGLDTNSINLILVDPPYFKVKGDYWDNEWDNPTHFIEWIGLLCKEWQRVLTPNGSLYVFASPQMSARVEVKVSEYFNVLNNIRWQKPPYSTKAEMFRKEDLRCYFPASENIVFAEQWWSDNDAEDSAGYYSQCKVLHKNVYSPVFGDYLQSEFDRAQVTRKQVSSLFPSVNGNLTGCVSNWVLGYNCPTKEQYQKIREYLNSFNGHADYLRKDYDYLRTQYEDLRRPFFASEDSPYTDVWSFPTVQTYTGKHPCEKPLDMLEHMINISSRAGDTVLDCFFGSCNTGIACQRTGRKFIGIERDKKYFERGQRRMNNARAELRGEWKPLKDEGGSLEGLPMFAGSIR